MAGVPGLDGEPAVRLGRGVADQLEAGLRREWLVTNGIGGYAMGTLAGPPTRSYHGWLVAALDPPVGRTVLVGGLDAWAVDGAGRRWPMAAFAWSDGSVAPQGWPLQEAMWLEGTIVALRFRLGGSLVDRRVWMAHGTNTTFVRYELAGGDPLSLELTPLVTCRDHHALSSGAGWQPEISPAAGGATVRAREGAIAFRLLAAGADLEPGGAWWWGFRYPAETERGLPDRGDLFAVGRFVGRIDHDAPLTLAFTTDAGLAFDETAAARALREERTRQAELIVTAKATAESRVVRQLVLAADQFVVRRDVPGRVGGSGRSLIAGYPWFNDWGRDTMIALPGLLLATGRNEEAAGVLRDFGTLVRGGLLPNNFPDATDAEPGYNTVDAALWYILDVAALAGASRSAEVPAELLPTCRAILDGYSAGSQYGIGVDPADGLLRSGGSGVALTWMDALVDGRAVTPREGKAVEIQALWHAALLATARLLETATRGADRSAAAIYREQAARASVAVRARFVRPGAEHLADVVDGPSGDDWSLRPNQLLALCLEPGLVDERTAARALDAVDRALAIGIGLRSLDPAAAGYRGTYSGDQHSRDTAYHQGTAWPWLIGPYLSTRRRLGRDSSLLPTLMALVADHLLDAGLGSVSEILDGDPPFTPRGCPFQAWSVAEALRLLRYLGSESA